jgi:GT2 family glycosyltransferase
MNIFPQKVAIIVLNWNGWEETKSCIESLLPILNNNTHLIICDNASTDDSWHYLQHFETNQFITLIQTGSNKGFAGGMNVGIKYALENLHPDFVWLLNNDVQIYANALKELLVCSDSKKNIGMWGSTLLENNEKTQCAGGCRYYSFLTIFKPILSGKNLEEIKKINQHKIKLDYIAGAALFIRREVIEKVGFLNEEYFLFYEELDYTQRLKKAGFGIAWCKESIVIHKGSASVGNVKDRDKNKIKKANYYENLSTLKYSRNFYPKTFWIIFINRFVLKSLALIITGRWYLFAPLFKAYEDYFKLPKT